MPTVTAYFDECVDYRVVALIRARGFLARTAQDVGMDAESDDEQIRYANTNDWLLLTHNERHFRRWNSIFQQNQWPHHGIITVPYSLLIPRSVIRFAMMLDWIKAEALGTESRLFRWNDL